MTAFRTLLCTAALLLSPMLANPETLRVAGQRLFVPAQVEGRHVDALLDSGAEMTLVDAAYAERLGLDVAGSKTARGSGGEQSVSFASGVDVRVADTQLDDLTVAVLDLTDISRRLIGEPLAVVIGRELFDSGRFLLDIEQGRFERVERDAAPAGVALPLRDNAGIKQIPLTIEGVEAWADFDLGNGSGMMIGRDLVERNGWQGADRHAGTATGGGLGGEVSRDLVRLQSVQIAGVELGPLTAAVDALDHAATANVGVDLLRRFVLTIDFPDGRVWLAPRQADDSGAQ